MDGIARDGLRFNHFGTKALCSTTRAALLTGRNNQTVGMPDLASTVANDIAGHSIPANAEFLSSALRKSGYSTFMVGKWHISPPSDTGEAGKNKSWPLQRGFDRFYGFLSGWTNQYHPEIVDDNTKIPAPVSADYHFATDITDHAISYLRGRDPKKPFFLYYAASIAHAPLHVPASYIDKYEGAYDGGWDMLRQKRFERMKSLGIIPRNTRMPPPNPGEVAWSSLTPVEKKVYARFMQTYAGFLEHGDAQIGRVLAYLRESGLDRNTMVIVISDNGAAGEGQKTGGFRAQYGDKMPIEQIASHLSELGTDKTMPLYQRAWAMASGTPFRRYKSYPYLGGVRTPLIVSWPGRVAQGATVRTQHVDVIDVAPTILDAAGARFSDVVDGVRQIPVAGKSFLPVLASASAPSPRTTQFFELRNNRAIEDGDWRAVAMHRLGTPFDRDDWKLFNLASDFSESTDVAARYPARLAAMKRLWQQEAAKHGDAPLREPESRARWQYGDEFGSP